MKSRKTSRSSRKKSIMTNTKKRKLQSRHCSSKQIDKCKRNSHKKKSKSKMQSRSKSKIQSRSKSKMQSNDQAEKFTCITINKNKLTGEIDTILNYGYRNIDKLSIEQRHTILYNAMQYMDPYSISDELKTGYGANIKKHPKLAKIFHEDNEWFETLPEYKEKFAECYLAFFKWYDSKKQK